MPDRGNDMAKPMTANSKRVRRIAAAVFLIAVLPTVFFGLRTYGSFRLLHSAYAAGAPMTSSVRGWMTLAYVAATYRAPGAALAERLGLPPGTDPNTSLRTLAEQAGVAPSVYVQQVQHVLAALSPNLRSDHGNDEAGWLGAIGDQVLTALLVYGYPALALTLFVGAIGLPLPDGVATTVAGSLASQGRIDWFAAAAIAVFASLLGDAAGYGIGRVLSRKFLERHGHWLGFTAARRVRVQSLFERWGVLTIFITRTFMSYLSSIASLAAGLSHYHLPKFLGVALAGRLLWTAGYFGLGYGIGADWQAATGFLTNVSVLLLLLLLMGASGAVASGRFTGA